MYFKLSKDEKYQELIDSPLNERFQQLQMAARLCESTTSGILDVSGRSFEGTVIRLPLRAGKSKLVKTRDHMSPSRLRELCVLFKQEV